MISYVQTLPVMFQKFSALLIAAILLLPQQIFAAAPTWTTYNIGDGLQAEGIDIRYSSYEGEFGLLYAKTGATPGNADGYFRLYQTGSVDGDTFSAGTLIKDVYDSYPINGSVVRLSFNEAGQYVFVKPSVSQGVNDYAEFGTLWSFATPAGMSQSFARGDLLPEQSGTIIFATALQDSLAVNRKIIAYVSEDGGATFSQVDIATNLESQPNQVFVFRLAAGGFAVVWSESGNDGNFIRVSTSADGATWSSPITNDHGSPAVSFLGPISAAIDSSDNIYVAFPHAYGPDFPGLSLSLKLAKFPAAGSAWNTDETVADYLAPTYVPNFEAFTFHEIALGIVSGTTPLIAYYELGSNYSDPAAPGSVKYALREAGTGCSGTDGANFTCGTIDSSVPETTFVFDSGIPTPLDLEIQGTRAVVVYNDIENSKLKAAYTTVTLDAGGGGGGGEGGGGGGGGGIPEFSDYVYIATIILGAGLIKKYAPKQAA